MAGWRPYSDALFGLACQIFYVGNCKDSVACRATLADAGLADLLEQDDREVMVHSLCCMFEKEVGQADDSLISQWAARPFMIMVPVGCAA